MTSLFWRPKVFKKLVHERKTLLPSLSKRIRRRRVSDYEGDWPGRNLIHMRQFDTLYGTGFLNSIKCPINQRISQQNNPIRRCPPGIPVKHRHPISRKHIRGRQHFDAAKQIPPMPIIAFAKLLQKRTRPTTRIDQSVSIIEYACAVELIVGNFIRQTNDARSQLARRVEGTVVEAGVRIKLRQKMLEKPMIIRLPLLLVCHMDIRKEPDALISPGHDKILISIGSDAVHNHEKRRQRTALASFEN